MYTHIIYIYIYIYTHKGWTQTHLAVLGQAAALSTLLPMSGTCYLGSGTAISMSGTAISMRQSAFDEWNLLSRDFRGMEPHVPP